MGGGQPQNFHGGRSMTTEPAIISIPTERDGIACVSFGLMLGVEAGGLFRVRWLGTCEADRIAEGALYARTLAQQPAKSEQPKTLCKLTDLVRIIGSRPTENSPGK